MSWSRGHPPAVPSGVQGVCGFLGSFPVRVNVDARVLSIGPGRSLLPGLRRRRCARARVWVRTCVSTCETALQHLKQNSGLWRLQRGRGGGGAWHLHPLPASILRRRPRQHDASATVPGQDSPAVPVPRPPDPTPRTGNPIPQFKRAPVTEALAADRARQRGFVGGWVVDTKHISVTMTPTTR